MTRNDEPKISTLWWVGAILAAILVVGLVVAVSLYGDYLVRMMNRQRLDDAHTVGFISGRNGVPIQSNPYAPGDGMYEQWIKGWQQGHTEAATIPREGK